MVWGLLANDPKVVRLGLRCVLITKITVWHREYILNKYRVQVWTKEDLAGFATIDVGRCGVPTHAIGSTLSGCARPFQPVLSAVSRKPSHAIPGLLRTGQRTKRAVLALVS